MNQTEWEKLCDGCGKCCLHKLEDVDTGDIAITDVACSYLDPTSCQCSDYTHRQLNVSDCVKLSTENIAEFTWLPETCAYRLISEGKKLPNWHHLICGDKEEVHRTKNSTRGRVISEIDLDDLQRYFADGLDAKENDWVFMSTFKKNLV